MPAPGGRAAAEQQRWYDRYLRDVDNGVDPEPEVQLLLADGDREDMLAGKFVTTDGADWPLPGTTWALPAARIPNGSLGLATPRGVGTQPYLAIPSLPTITDSTPPRFSTPPATSTPTARRTCSPT